MTILQQVSILFICTATIFITGWQKHDAENYTIDISGNHPPVLTGHLHLGTNKNAVGETVDANSLYFIKNGKPWYPVMGEFHFNRFPRDQWESSILKMKAAGIDVIATYIFWIYHEEDEGKWDWSGNRDLHYFAQLCAKHQVYLFARIGPWCHGEVRNGGFPDWLLNKSFKPRTNDTTYVDYVRKLFLQVNKQLNGLYFKDGGPVIGAQMENEFRFNNPKGLEHILNLKRIAIDAGIDVPFYTATGWPGSDIKQTELVPVWGAYPEAPWDKRTTQLPLSENYLFAPLRSDPNIGDDLLGKINDTTNYSGYRYPYATAEMGAGIQITYHRRPIINTEDVTGLAYVKIGSGANLIGYYMFHGGSNAIGKLSTLQESKATKYPNDYPIINYDFQSPIGEWGNLRPSYNAFKVLHYFLNDFGDALAQDYAFFPEKKPTGPEDAEVLRWSVRANNNSGFIFINNFQRQLQLPDFKNVQFNIKSKAGLLILPQQPVSIPANTQAIWPFNMALQDVNLAFATVQPLCKLENGNKKTFVFYETNGIKATYTLDEKNIERVDVANASVTKENGRYTINITKTGIESFIHLRLQNGKTIDLLTLTKEQALNSWKFAENNNDHLCISNAALIYSNNTMQLQSTGSAKVDLAVYPSLQKISTDKNCSITKINAAPFALYKLSFPEKNFVVRWHSFTPMALSNHSYSPGMPQYRSWFNEPGGARFWNVPIPSYVLQGLSNAFLKIEYEGDTEAAYDMNGKLIADDFYSGVPAMIGLNQVKEVAGKNIRLLITPLSDSSKIYFEKGIREPLMGKKAAAIKNITVIPQYTTAIKLF